jgi:hypothetical protein
MRDGHRDDEQCWWIAGASGIRHPPRPLGGSSCNNSGASARARDVERCNDITERRVRLLAIATTKTQRLSG